MNYPLGNNLLFRIFQKSCKEAPGLLGNQPAVQILPILHSGLRVFPKLTRGPGFLQFGPKFEKYLQKAPKFLEHVDSCAKILRITSSFFLCIHITHVCCILLIDCMYLLHGRNCCAGTVVWGYSRPSLRGVPAVLRGSTRQVSLNMLHLWLIFSTYSVELELHGRKVWHVHLC
jgi:hypothetical protein